MKYSEYKRQVKLSEVLDKPLSGYYSVIQKDIDHLESLREVNGEISVRYVDSEDNIIIHFFGNYIYLYFKYSDLYKSLYPKYSNKIAFAFIREFIIEKFNVKDKPFNIQLSVMLNDEHIIYRF
jgi:hypothetical protein